MTSIQPPPWLNLDAVIPPDVLQRIAAAIRALTDIEACIEKFAEDHGAAIFDYQAHSDGLPDEVWLAIDETTGYHQLHIDLYNFGQRLQGLADGKEQS